MFDEKTDGKYKKINGQHDPSRSKWRKLDYYEKGLPTPVQQKLWHTLDYEKYPFIDRLAEKDIGYPEFRKMGWSEGMIQRCEERASEYFKSINSFMAENHRCALFPNPEDTCASSKLYFDLIELRSYEDMIQFFGCEYPDYWPALYLPETGEILRFECSMKDVYEWMDSSDETGAAFKESMKERYEVSEGLILNCLRNDVKALESCIRYNSHKQNSSQEV